MNSRNEMKLQLSCYITLHQLKEVLTVECNEDSGRHASQDRDTDMERCVSGHRC